MAELSEPPVLGETVLYVLTEADAEAVNRRRADADATRAGQQTTGFQVHVGNRAGAGHTYPMVVTRVWDTATVLVNGQVLLDGNDTLWVSSVAVSPTPEPGHYHRRGVA